MSPRLWRLGGIGAAVLVLLAAWFLVISPTLSKAAALDVETAGQQQASDQLESRISLLKKQSEELPAQEAILAEVAQRMPATVALPTLIRNLTTVATKANVKVAAVSPGRPTPVAQPVAPASPPKEADAESEDSKDSGDSADAEGAASAPADAVATTPVGPQVESVSLNISACGTFAQLRNYLRQLESMKRVVMVSTVSVARGSCAEGAAQDDLTASISAYAFTMPNANPDSTEADSDSTQATKDDSNE
jgi:Tfp pilus assembly protein PilO